MKNIMKFGQYKAAIDFDPEIEMFRGEFINLNGGADFYAPDIEGLKKEGDLSLKAFIEMCEEDGVEPLKEYSGKFNVRIEPALHERLAQIASSTGDSLNQLVSDVLSKSAEPGAFK